MKYKFNIIYERLVEKMEGKTSYNVLVVGDPHFKISNLRVMRDFVDKLEYLITKKGKEYFDFMVCLGDTLHTHNKLEQDCLKAAIDFFKRIAKYMPVYVLIGNHDRPREQVFLTDEHPFHGLDDSPNIKIVWKVEEIIDMNNNRFVFVPYVSSGRFREALSTLPVSIKDHRPLAIFAHQEFRGCKLSEGKVSTSDDVWGTDEPYMISGHIHDYQKVQDNLVYVGTPVQHTFGERTDKTVIMFKIANDVDYARVQVGGKVKETIDCTLDNISELELDERNDIRLKIQCKKEEIKPFEKTKKYKELKNKGIKFVYNYVNDKKSTNCNKSWLELMKEKCNDEQKLLLDELLS